MSTQGVPPDVPKLPPRPEDEPTARRWTTRIAGLPAWIQAVGALCGLIFALLAFFGIQDIRETRDELASTPSERASITEFNEVTKTAAGRYSDLDPETEMVALLADYGPPEPRWGVTIANRNPDQSVAADLEDGQWTARATTKHRSLMTISVAIMQRPPDAAQPPPPAQPPPDDEPSPAVDADQLLELRLLGPMAPVVIESSPAITP